MVAISSTPALFLLSALLAGAGGAAPQAARQASAAGDELDASRLPGEAPPAPGTLFLYPERITVQSGDVVTAERGMLFTRLVRDDPASAVIGVEVYRFRAAPGVPADTPPLFQLNGGPGWPGLGGSLERPGFYESEILPKTAMADVVYVGQRGIGSSKPNTVCESVAAPPGQGALDDEEEAELLRRGCADCRAYWEAQGYDLRGFNVVEAAGDVDEVRRLLGYDQITISGGSFGSHWGMAVMRYYPAAVARAVLTGMEGPDHTYDMPSGVLAALERMAGDAELSSQLVEHIPEEGLMGALEAVLARLEEEPVEVTVQGRTVRFEADDLPALALGYTGRVNSRGGAASWPADVIALYRGEFERAAQARLQSESGGRTVDLPTASFFMLDCGSGISPAREAQLNADPAARIVGALGDFYQTTCPVWEADLGDEFRAGFRTDIPTLIVHGTWDVSTPFDNALELLDTFENGHFVVVDGGTHGALGEALRLSDAFRSAMADFVTHGDMSSLPEEIRMPPVAWSAPHK